MDIEKIVPERSDRLCPHRGTVGVKGSSAGDWRESSSGVDGVEWDRTELEPESTQSHRKDES